MAFVDPASDAYRNEEKKKNMVDLKSNSFGKWPRKDNELLVVYLGRLFSVFFFSVFILLFAF